MPELGTLIVTGSDRQTWLNGLVTCDLAPAEAAACRGEGRASRGRRLRRLNVGKTGKIFTPRYEIVIAADRASASRRCGSASSEQLRTESSSTATSSWRTPRSRTPPAASTPGVFAHGPRSAELRGGRAPRPAPRTAIVDWTGLGGALLVAPRQAEGAVLEALLAGGEARAGPAGDGGGVGGAPGREQRPAVRGSTSTTRTSRKGGASIERSAPSRSTRGATWGRRQCSCSRRAAHAGGSGSCSSPSRRRAACPRARRSRCPTARPSAPSRKARSGIRARTGLLALGCVKYKHAVQGTALRVAGRAAEITRAPGQGTGRVRAKV